MAVLRSAEHGSRGILTAATFAWALFRPAVASEPAGAKDRPQSSEAGPEGEFAELVSWAQDAADAHVPADMLAEAPRIADVLKIRTEGSERVVVAGRDVKAGDLILRIPMQRLMHAGYYKVLGSSSSVPAKTLTGPAYASTLAPAMHAALADGLELTTYVAPQTWLALYMLEHRRLGTSSAWNPYLRLLPSSFPSNPLYFTDEDWAGLEGSSFVPRALHHKERVRNQFETVCKLVPGFSENYTLDDYVWARAAISSRVFGDSSLPGIGEEGYDFMVPLGDMFNHRSPKQINWFFNATTNTLDYRAMENVTTGEELLISYGGKCNSQYLLHYGFALPDVVKRRPPVSTVRILFGIDDSIPDREIREAWLRKSALVAEGEELPAEAFEVRASARGNQYKNMLAYARLLTLPVGGDFGKAVKARGCREYGSPGHPPRCDRMFSIDNEKSALSLCLSVVERAVAAYPTTLEEDEALLSSDDGRPHGVPRFLLILRRDEKVVLRWWLRFFGIALEAISLSPEEIERRADKEFGEFGPDGEYLRVSLSALVSVERGPNEL